MLSLKPFTDKGLRVIGSEKELLRRLAAIKR